MTKVSKLMGFALFGFLALACAGCPYTLDAYADDVVELTCRAVVEYCGETWEEADTVPECIDYINEEEGGRIEEHKEVCREDFEPEAARACINAWYELMDTEGCLWDRADVEEPAECEGVCWFDIG